MPCGTLRATLSLAGVRIAERDLAPEVLAGRFRKDLHDRINVIELRLPPLSERKGDIPGMTCDVLDTLSSELGVLNPELSALDVEPLMAYDWPGNCRELRNIVERALLLGKPISHDLGLGTSREVETGVEDETTDQSLEEVQRAHIINAVAGVATRRSPPVTSASRARPSSAR